MNKSKRHILIVCNAPFQILVALHIMDLYYSDAIVDFVVSNQFKGGQAVAENAKQTGRFRNVFYIESMKWTKHYKSFSDKIKYYSSLLISVVQSIKNVQRINRNVYDDILFTNISVFTKLLCTYILKRNKNCKIHIFEEGLGTYSQVYANSDSEKSFYRRFFDKEGIFNKLSTLYLFHPQLLTWQFPSDKICKLPNLSAENKRFLKTANMMFDYASNTDIYDRKVIFFEESYFVEGEAAPDVDIVEEMSRHIGKENIMIKVHPRNPINRFETLGYKTNKNNSIPWELIMLNQPMTDKIFVTIASGAAINPYLYLGLKVQSFSLLNCLAKRPGIMNSQLGELMLKAYFTYPEYLKAPTNMQSFIDSLTALINQRCFLS